MTETPPPAAPPAPDIPAVKPGGSKGKKWGWLLAALAVISLVAYLNRPHHQPTAAGFTVSGSVEIDNINAFSASGLDTCNGIWDYDTMDVGFPIVIDDGNNVPLARGSFTASKYEEDRGACLLTFEVTNVPSGWKSYGFLTPISYAGGFTENDLKTGPIILPPLS